jgi:hypothetical protein
VAPHGHLASRGGGGQRKRHAQRPAAGHREHQRLAVDLRAERGHRGQRALRLEAAGGCVDDHPLAVAGTAVAKPLGSESGGLDVDSSAALDRVDVQGAQRDHREVSDRFE